jgi:TonB family protein
MTSLLQWASLTALLGAASIASAADSAKLAKRLHNAADASSLDDGALKPWHLKLDVQLYDDKGNPSEKGTVEEWWTSEKDKRVYATPSYSVTEIRDGKALYRTKDAEIVPYLLEAMRRCVVHPIMPLEFLDKSSLELKEVAFGKAKLDCVMVSGGSGGSNATTAGKVQTYCLNQDNDKLRASWLDPEIDIVNGTGIFQGKAVAINSSIRLFERNAITAHVESLSGLPAHDALFVHDDGFEDGTAKPVWVDHELEKIKTVPPRYPPEALAKHLSGVVLLEVILGKDGRVEMLKPIGRSDPSLTSSARDAVEQWIYKPHTVNGIAVEARTKIAVHFSFAPE